MGYKELPSKVFAGLMALLITLSLLLSACSLLGSTTQEVIPENPGSTAPEASLPAVPQAVEPLIISQVWNQVEVPGRGMMEAYVECPAGSIVLSGGYGTVPEMPVYTSLMVGNGWSVYGENTTDISLNLNVYAICLATTTATTTAVSIQVNLPPNDAGSAYAECPPGSIVTGGGYATSLVTLPKTSFWEGNTWFVAADNQTSSEAPIAAVAVCLSGLNAITGAPLVQVEIAPNESGLASMGCEEGSYLVGGGFASNNGLIIYNSSMNEVMKQWEVYAQDIGLGGLINAYATCLTQQ